MAPRAGRCWYCGRSVLADDDPPEHIIPSVLGAELTTDRVCLECNRKAGQYIDKPLLDEWLVAWERVLWDIRDVRRSRDKPPPMPKEELTLPDGTSVKLESDGSLRVIPSVDRDGDKIHIQAGSTAEAEKIVRKIEERAKRDGKELTLEETRRELSSEVAGRFVLDGVVWLRASTKMAVAAASLVLDESWLDTNQAAKYREFLWAEAPTTLDGSDQATAFPIEQHPLITEFATPPNHLILMTPSPGRMLMVIVLFGSLSAGSVEFAVKGTPPRNAWILDPVDRTVEETTFDALVEEVALRHLDGAGG